MRFQILSLRRKILRLYSLGEVVFKNGLKHTVLLEAGCSVARVSVGENVVDQMSDIFNREHGIF